MTVPGNLSSPLLATATGAAAAAEYVIPKSLRFNDDDQAYLAKTVTSVGDQRRMTFSFWIKRHSVSSSSGFAIFAQDYLTSPSNAVVDRSLSMLFDGDRLELYDYGASSGHGDSGSVQAWTAGVVQEGSDNVLFRDPSAWYSVIFAIDTTQSTAANRCKVWINGVQRTMSGYPVQNSYLSWGQAKSHYIGIQKTNGSFTRAGDFSLADVHFIDGQQLSNTDFGEFDSNGIWRPKEASVTSPNNGTIWSSLVSNAASSYPATNLFDGNLSTYAEGTSGGGDVTFSGGTITGTTIEFYGGKAGSSTFSVNGVDKTSLVPSSSGWFTITGVTSITAFAFNRGGPGNYVDLFAIRVDGVILIDGAGTYGKNGFHLNFGDSSTNEALGFDSAPTTPDPDPKKGMDVVTYSGTGAVQNVGGLLFEPGLTWIKSRSNSNEGHYLYDSVRGANKPLYSHATAAEGSSTNQLNTFNPDGFTLGSNNAVNSSSHTFVAWTWRAGGPAVSNTDGTVTSQVSVSTDYGFSICTYTGGTADASIGHGLGQTPKFYIVKARTSSGYTDSWNVYHTSLGASAYIKLQSNAAATTGSTIWNETAPTSTVFYVDANSNANENNTDYVAYVWSEKSGFSKFGTYEGASTVTVTTGFRPRWILLKNVDASGSWSIFDSERDSDLEINHRIYANESSADGTNIVIGNFTDTGFTLTNQGNSNWNTTGDTFVYAAFADRPGNNWDVNNIVTNEGLTTSKSQFDVVTWTGNGGNLKVGGPVYSAGATATGGFESSNPAANGFNGTLTAGDRANGVTVGGTIEIVFSPGLSVSSTVGIWSGKSGFKYQINDSGSYTSVTNATEQWHDASFSGTLTNLKIQHTASNEAPGFSGIRVDGTTLLDGNGPGLKFQPDFVWIKDRSNNYSHRLADSVRGSTRVLFSDQTNAEQVNEYGTIDSFNSDGFTLRQGSNNSGVGSNTNNANMVAWCWKAGGTAVSNTNGSITSSVSANAQYGFSIVSWDYDGTTGQYTVGHGLNTAPSLIIVRPREITSNWGVFHSALGNTAGINLNQTNASSTSTGWWNNTSPTNSVFTLSTFFDDNSEYIAYCFADVPGYQRISSFIGNGSNSGPTVVCGFKPRFVLLKNKNDSDDWKIYDSERDPVFISGVNQGVLSPNSSSSELQNKGVEFTASGFTVKDSNNSINGSGDTIIYWAIGDDEIGSDEDCLVDVPNAVTADADATDTTGGYQRGNYATLNPLEIGSNVALSNGNLKAVLGLNGGNWRTVKSTIGVTSGKWYAEITSGPLYSSVSAMVGVVGIDEDVKNTYATAATNGYGYLCDGDQGVYTTTRGTEESWDDGDTVGIALDLDNDTLQFYKNGVAQGAAFTGLPEATYAFYVGGANESNTLIANFGQMRFKYPIPSGYAALNTTALPAATIEDGSAHFDAVLHTGDGNSTKEITAPFKADLIWNKARSSTTYNRLFDSVRGLTKSLYSGQNFAENEYQDYGYITATSDTSFTVGQGTDSGNLINVNSRTYVNWIWNAGANSNKTYTVKVVSDSGNKFRFDDFGTSAVTLDLEEGSTYVFDQSDSSNAGHPIRFGTSANGTDYTTGVTHTGTPGSAGAKTTLVLGTGVSTLYYSCLNHTGMGGQINTNSTAGASNFDGDVQATVKANPTAGFSIVKWTNNGNNTPSSHRWGHELNVIPDLVITKRVNNTGDWAVYSEVFSNPVRDELYLNTTGAKATAGVDLYHRDNTTVGIRAGSIGSSGDTHIAYCISAVAGYSAVGKYTGNGSSDGPFVWTGFRPAALLWKPDQGATDWVFVDAERNTYNVIDGYLLANTNGSEGTLTLLDFCSNGFKLRTSSTGNNTSGTTVYYIAWAENPFQANGGLAR